MAYWTDEEVGFLEKAVIVLRNGPQDVSREIEALAAIFEKVRINGATSENGVLSKLLLCYTSPGRSEGEMNHRSQINDEDVDYVIFLENSIARTVRRRDDLGEGLLDELLNGAPIGPTPHEIAVETVSMKGAVEQRLLIDGRVRYSRRVRTSGENHENSGDRAMAVVRQ